MNLFAKNLRYCRKQFGVSQSELASYVKKGQTTVGGWENNVSEPDINNLILISRFFGISIDFLLLNDLEKGNLITEEHVDNFKREGNLMGNRKGNLSAQNIANYSTDDMPVGLVAEAQQAAEWILLKKMEQLNENFDLLRISVEKSIKK